MRTITVKVEREIDVDRLLMNLNSKSKCEDPGNAGYDVNVAKQLLRDAHDIIRYFVDAPEIKTCGFKRSDGPKPGAEKKIACPEAAEW